VERGEDSIPILSLLPTGPLALLLLGVHHGSREKRLSVALPRSLCLFNASGTRLILFVGLHLISGTDSVGTA
jgi:hypothetical protein